MSAHAASPTPPPLTAQLCGPMAFTWNGEPLAVPPRLGSVIAFLALHGPTSREDLRDVFWPEGTTHHVRQALYSLRALTGAECWLTDAGGVVSVHATTDLPALEDLLDQAEVPLAELRRRPVGGLLSDLRDTRSGPFNEWLTYQRVQWDARRDAAFERWGAHALRTGQVDVALDVARVWTAADPLSERACQLLMRAHHGAGHPDGAQEAVAALRLAMRQALDAEPGEDTLTLLRELVGQGGERHGRAQRLSRTRPGPWAQEPLQGRAPERRRVEAALAASQRVGLHGLAGIGKTRLAAAAAMDRLEQDGGTVLWLTVGDDGPAAALAALGDALETRSTDQFAPALTRHDVRLCVLDDVWSAATLHAVLEVVPATLPVIVTSRERWAGLRALNVDRLPRRDSQALLCAHAPALSPDAVEVDALCALLGDHPYALRLAGRTLAATGDTPDALLRTLHGAPHTLGQGQITALLRQSVRTLDPAMYEAYLGLGSLPVSSTTPDLLALALRRPAAEVESALYALTGRGLCMREAIAGSEIVHYHMHDLTWSAARAHEALLPGTVGAATLAYARSATDEPARLDAERATILEVLLRARREQDDALLVDVLMAWLSGPYLAARGFPTGHLGVLREGGEVAQRNGRWREAAVLLGKLADVQHGLLGSGVEAADTYLRAADAAERAGLKERQATFLGLSATLRALHHLPDADATLERALRCAQESGDPVCLARLLEQRGMMRAMGGEFEEARTHFLEARSALAALMAGATPPAAAVRAYLNVTGSLAQAEQRLGHLNEAAELRQDALRQALVLDDHVHVANAHADLGEVYLRQGRNAVAREHLLQAVDLYRALGASGPETSARTLLDALPPENRPN